MGHSSSNAGGRCIKQLIDNRNIKHLPTNFDTWISAIGRGKPDIILTNNHNYLNVAISSGQTTTCDHIPIIVQPATSPIMLPTTARFNFSKADWESFREELTQIDEIDMDHLTTNKIDEETNKWFDQVTNAMEKYIPKTIYRTIPYPQITSEIKEIQ